jgi:hypothetical protein
LAIGICQTLGFSILKMSPLKRGEILNPPGGSVSQTIVFRYDEIGDILHTKHRNKVIFLSKDSLERNETFSSMYRTQYNPDCFVAELFAEHYTVCTSISPVGHVETKLLLDSAS